MGIVYPHADRSNEIDRDTSRMASRRWIAPSPAARRLWRRSGVVWSDDRLPPPPAHRRAGLTRERVLGAAIDLADNGGLEELSMRKLARSLGVEAMSLYDHISNKDHLLDGMIDLVFTEIDAPSADGEWREEMQRRAVSTRAALKRHVWAVGLMEARPNPGQANLRLHEAALACLRQAGFSIEMAIHAYSVQDAYIYGFALQEQTLSHDTREEWMAVAERILRNHASALDTHPHSADVQRHIAAHGFSHEDEFRFGLDLILDGLDRLLRAQ